MVQVHLDLSEPQQHLVAVQIQVAPRLARMRLALPGWTPGSYLMRDYVRQLEGLVVEQGSQVLDLQRLEPSAWGVECDPSGGLLTIRYRVLATELTVRTCHLDHEHGFLALAAVVLELERHMAGYTYAGPVGSLGFDAQGGCLAVSHDRKLEDGPKQKPMVF